MNEKNQGGFIITIVSTVVAVTLVIVTWFPRHGPPHFRYTGSDPSRDVWNLGIPLTTAIYDSIHGWQLGPIGYITLPLNVVAVIFVLVLWCRRGGGAIHRRGLRRDDLE